jgi:hypothetical protein
MRAIAQGDEAIEFASDELRNDREFMTTVMQQCPWAFLFASDGLRHVQLTR